MQDRIDAEVHLRAGLGGAERPVVESTIRPARNGGQTLPPAAARTGPRPRDRGIWPSAPGRRDRGRRGEEGARRVAPAGLPARGLSIGWAAGARRRASRRLSAEFRRSRRWIHKCILHRPCSSPLNTEAVRMNFAIGAWIPRPIGPPGRVRFRIPVRPATPATSSLRSGIRFHAKSPPASGSRSIGRGGPHRMSHRDTMSCGGRRGSSPEDRCGGAHALARAWGAHGPARVELGAGGTWREPSSPGVLELRSVAGRAVRTCFRKFSDMGGAAAPCRACAYGAISRATQRRNLHSVDRERGHGDHQSGRRGAGHAVRRPVADDPRWHSAGCLAIADAQWSGEIRERCSVRVHGRSRMAGDDGARPGYRRGPARWGRPGTGRPLRPGS